MTSFPDFSSIEALVASATQMPAFDTQAAEAARARQMELTKPPRALGRLEDLAEFLAGWQGTGRPVLDKAQAVVFAGNHGVCAKGVNPFPQEVTAQMVANFQAGGAAINQLCRLVGAELSVIPLQLDQPTQDISEAAAMTVSECLAAMRTGAKAVDPKADVLILGEMGIGNSTIAAALACGAFGGAPADWAGRGTGSDAKGVSLKARIVGQAVDRHGALSPLEQLAALGGREQAAICGAVLAARAARIPVVLDGYICTASAVPLFCAVPDMLDHCLVGHRSAEPGHRKLLAALNKEPILDFDMALGEGSGAALALNILKAAVACHNDMATFAEASVSEA